MKHHGRTYYDESLAAGHPIASGVIAATCRHVVKDGSERTGMTGTVDGTQAKLDVYCIHVRQAGDEFTIFHAHRVYCRYPNRSSLSQFGWTLAP